MLDDQSKLLELYLLGQARAIWRTGAKTTELHIQPKPLRLLAYLALNCERPHRREALQALFWPEKPAHAAANNLRQAIWHLRQALPAALLHVGDDVVEWAPRSRPWVDAQAFEAALEADDLDTALDLYQGPLLPDAVEEWAHFSRERLHLRYLRALETCAHRRYEARSWDAAMADAEMLLAADPLNEAATRLLMACQWALDQREAARRTYDAFRHRLRTELVAEPLPETVALFQRILCGESHPAWSEPATDAAIAARVAHLSLLETLGGFNQGLAQATAWVAEASDAERATALRWQGRFCLRLGDLTGARAALTEAIPLVTTVDLEAAVLADLATTETGMGEYAEAERHYVMALDLSPLSPGTHLRLLTSYGGLLGRTGHAVRARQILEQAVSQARSHEDPASLATAAGNLGILLIGMGEAQTAQAILDEGLDAARQAGAHWLVAHLTGHLGVLAQDREDFASAADYYERARTLADTFGARRHATLWTLNLGVVCYEQGRWADAVPLLEAGRDQAASHGSRALEAGATIFLGSCLVATGDRCGGLAAIEKGLALAREIGDRERTLIGLLHYGRALALTARISEATTSLQEGLDLAQASQNQRMAAYFCAELASILPPS